MSPRNNACIRGWEQLMFLFETVFSNGIIGPGTFSLLNLRNAINMRQNIIFM